MTSPRVQKDSLSIGNKTCMLLLSVFSGFAATGNVFPSMLTPGRVAFTFTFTFTFQIYIQGI